MNRQEDFTNERKLLEAIATATNQTMECLDGLLSNTLELVRRLKERDDSASNARPRNAGQA